MAALILWTGRDSIWVQEGMFFSQAALVAFGDAYAVLAYIAQQAVRLGINPRLSVISHPPDHVRWIQATRNSTR